MLQIELSNPMFELNSTLNTYYKFNKYITCERKYVIQNPRKPFAN